MSAAYVRRYYGVPAKRGGRIRFQGEPGRIASFDGQYLRARLGDERHSVKLHPTWRVQYLDDSGQVIWPKPQPIATPELPGGDA